MSRIMLLAAALVSCAAYASSSSGDQLAVAQVGKAAEPIYLIRPSHALADAPECNATRGYVLKGRQSRVFIAMSLLVNLHTRGVWKGVPNVHITGTGGCSQLRGSEDVRTIEFYDGDQSVFFLGDTLLNQIDKALEYVGWLGNRVRLDERPAFDPNHPHPLYLPTMEPTGRTLLKPSVVSFHSDLCTMSPTDALDKWATRGTRPSELDRLALSHLPSLLGVPGLITAEQKVACAAMQASGYRRGINQYAEYIRRDAASVIWRDDNRNFQGMAFFNENGSWKVDLTNGY
jgi:hypothetical protein